MLQFQRHLFVSSNRWCLYVLFLIRRSIFLHLLPDLQARHGTLKSSGCIGLKKLPYPTVSISNYFPVLWRARSFFLQPFYLPCGFLWHACSQTRTPYPTFPSVWLKSSERVSVITHIGPLYLANPHARRRALMRLHFFFFALVSKKIFQTFCSNNRSCIWEFHRLTKVNGTWWGICPDRVKWTCWYAVKQSKYTQYYTRKIAVEAKRQRADVQHLKIIVC